MSEDIEKIKGVGSSTASKLRAAGYVTVEALAVSPAREVAAKTGLSDDAASKICGEARKLLNLSFVKAVEIWERRKGLLRCTIGSKKLDGVLGGGIETQAMTELIGGYGVGKTQICLTLSVTAQLPKDEGGLEGNVIYMDTEGTFSADRVYQIALSRGVDGKKILDGILVARAYTSDHQRFLIDCLFRKVPEENAKLVVVDSMISHFRGEYIGRNELSERQQILNQCLHKLIRLAEAYNVAVVITNQVVSNPAPFCAPIELPTGGHVMAHACTHRVHIKKGKAGTRVAKIIDSPYLPESKAPFMISEKGIEDTEREPEEEDEGQLQTVSQKS